jgi:hypothetical protein
MGKAKRLAVGMMLLLALASCQVNVSAPERTGDHGLAEVRGLVLKYAIIDTSYEIYQTQIQKSESLSRMAYMNAGEDIYGHYKWMATTYENMEPEMKAYLKQIFDEVHAWQLLNTTTALDDDATLEIIVASIRTRLRRTNIVEAADRFFPYFYESHFKDYLLENEPVFSEKAERLNHQIRQNNPDILTFMEEQSGILFERDYQPLFYYTLRYIGAMGFNYNGVKVSTIQRNVNDYSKIMLTPFHEYSHELFQTFTRQKRFEEIADKMKEVSSFKKMWESGYHYSYDWVGWCEENLVEGFSKYLAFKYYDYGEHYGNYAYDGEFYRYLVDSQFDPKTNTLENISIEFYEKVYERDSD